jgi:hypothetical protein
MLGAIQCSFLLRTVYLQLPSALLYSKAHFSTLFLGHQFYNFYSTLSISHKSASPGEAEGSHVVIVYFEDDRKVFGSAVEGQLQERD